MYHAHLAIDETTTAVISHPLRSRVVRSADAAQYTATPCPLDCPEPGKPLTMVLHYHRWHLASTGGAYFRMARPYRTRQAASKARPQTWSVVDDDRATVRAVMVLACEGECQD